MSYQGFCAKYGVHYVMPLAVGLPIALTAAFRAVQGQPMDEDDFFFSFMGGAVGFIAGAAAHEIANVYLHYVQAGTREGADIVKKTQAIFYSIPVICGLALNALSPAEPSAPEKPAPDGIRQNDNQLQRLKLLP